MVGVVERLNIGADLVRVGLVRYSARAQNIFRMRDIQVTVTVRLYADK